MCLTILHLLSSNSASECILIDLSVIKFIDHSSSEACIYLRWKLTAWLPGTYVAKYSLIFCGNLISQERMWLIKSIRLHHENINHVSRVSLSTSGWTYARVQMCACPSERVWVHRSAATSLSTEGICVCVCVCLCNS